MSWPERELSVVPSRYIALLGLLVAVSATAEKPFFDSAKDEYRGQQFEVYYDDQNQTARILDANSNKRPTLIALWFAWYEFHPDTEIYTAN